MRRLVFLIGCIAALTLSGCGGESNLPKAKGEGNLRAINAIPTSGNFTFLIEERAIGNVDYRTSSSTTSYDGLDYVFNFETVLPGSIQSQRVASQPLTVRDATDYVLVITGAPASPTIAVWESAIRTWDGSETVFAVRFGHTNSTIGDVDVYFADPGVAPVLGNQRGTLSLGEVLPIVELPEGDYVVIMTNAGSDPANPANILFTSDTLAINARSSLLFNIFDADPNVTGPVAVHVINASGLSSYLPDSNYLPTIRFIHASMALETSDIYAEEVPTTPIKTGHFYTEITGDVEIAAGSTLLTYTAENNVGVTLFDNTYVIPGGLHSRYIVVGADIDSLTAVTTLQDRRPDPATVKFRFMNAASNFELIDVYLTDDALGIDDKFPRLLSVAFGNSPTGGPLSAGSYNLYVAPAGEKTVLAGPMQFDAALGDIVDFIAMDTVDPATVQVLPIPVL